jgi:hypothetical protein
VQPVPGRLRWHEPTDSQDEVFLRHRFPRRSYFVNPDMGPTQATACTVRLTDGRISRARPLRCRHVQEVAAGNSPSWHACSTEPGLRSLLAPFIFACPAWPTFVSSYPPRVLLMLACLHAYSLAVALKPVCISSAPTVSCTVALQ